jgi:alpha/beta superfamily hydrolase
VVATRPVYRILGLILMAAASVTTARADGNLEQAVCNRLFEPFAFWLWQHAAGTPHAVSTTLPPNVEIIHYTTADQRRLAGYRIHAGNESKGFVLVAQGNATLVERLIAHLGTLAEAGYDVYLYDYRGYGSSEGKRRFKAIVSDYREIFATLSSSHPGKRLLYGMSFGGIVLLNVIGTGVAFDRGVIDSTPATISNYGCPRRYDPVANLPADSSGLLLIAGDRDRVVPADESAALLEAGAGRGARAQRSPDFAHPFMDKDQTVYRERQELIRGFLTGR